MRFIFSWAFLVQIFYTQAFNEGFLRRCEQEGIIDIEGTLAAQLPSPLVDVSTYLSKYYAQCLVVALRKNSQIRNKREHEQLRIALQCLLKPCVISTFGANKFGNISAQLSTSILKVKSSCNVLSNYKRGSLSKVAYSAAINAALDYENLKRTSLKGILHQLRKLVGDAFGSAQGSVLASLDLDDLLDGLRESVKGLLSNLAGNLEFSLLVGGPSSIGPISGPRRVKKEIFDVYKCDLGTVRNKDYDSCTVLSCAIDEVISTFVALRATFDRCLSRLHADVLDMHYDEILKC